MLRSFLTSFTSLPTSTKPWIRSAKQKYAPGPRTSGTNSIKLNGSGAKTPKTSRPKEELRLQEIDQESLATAKAYQMKLVLQDIYREPQAGKAQDRFQTWCRWVKEVAVQQPKNVMAAMVKVADMILNHFKGILAHWKWGLTNAFMEGLNSVFQATKRKARGYRSSEYLITILYLIAGKLRLPHF